MNHSRQVALNTISLSTASAVRILLGLFLTVYIARTHGTFWLGQYGILLSFINIFRVLGSFGLPRLITREIARHPQASNVYFYNGLMVQSLAELLSAVAMLVVIQLMHYAAATKVMLDLAVLVLLPNIFYTVAMAVLSGHEQMHFITLADTANSIAQVGLVLWLLPGASAPTILAWIKIAGNSVAALVLLTPLFILQMVGRPAWDLRAAKMLWRQALHFFGFAGFNALLFRLDTLIVSNVLGEAATGIYEAANQIVRVFLVLVIALTDAVFPLLSRLFQTDRTRFRQAMRNTLQVATMFLLPVIALLSFLAAPVVPLLFGRNPAFLASASLLRWLVWMIWPALFYTLLSRGLLAAHLQKAAMFMAGGVVLFGILLGSALCWRFGLLAMPAVDFLIYAFGSAVSLRILHRRGIRLQMGYGLRRPAAALFVMLMLYLPLHFWSPWPSAAVALAGYMGTFFLLGGFNAEEKAIISSLMPNKQRPGRK